MGCLGYPRLKRQAHDLVRRAGERVDAANEIAKQIESLLATGGGGESAAAVLNTQQHNGIAITSVVVIRSRMKL